MGNKYARPDPLELARAGDEDALEQVLGGIVAPIFDLALLRYHGRERAEVAVVDGLRAVADAIATGGPEQTPLAEAARVVLAADADVPPLPGDASDLERRLETLPDDQRRAFLGQVVCDLDPAELTHAVGLPTAGDLAASATAAVHQAGEDLKASVEERVGAFSLPFGLIDRALA